MYGSSIYIIYINVKIKGKDYKFVFDTGTENTYKTCSRETWTKDVGCI